MLTRDLRPATAGIRRSKFSANVTVGLRRWSGDKGRADGTARNGQRKKPRGDSAGRLPPSTHDAQHQTDPLKTPTIGLLDQPSRPFSGSSAPSSSGTLRFSLDRNIFRRSEE